MANGEQLALLRRGIEAWNAGRATDTETPIGLREADLLGAALLGSSARVFPFASLAIIGLAYLLHLAMIDFPRCRGPAVCRPGFSGFCFSITSYMTLGFGDIHPRTDLGEVVAKAEATLGYLSLGLLLAVLAGKVARRG